MWGTQEYSHTLPSVAKQIIRNTCNTFSVTYTRGTGQVNRKSFREISNKREAMRGTGCLCEEPSWLRIIHSCNHHVTWFKIDQHKELKCGTFTLLMLESAKKPPEELVKYRCRFSRSEIGSRYSAFLLFTGPRTILGEPLTLKNLKERLLTKGGQLEFEGAHTFSKKRVQKWLTQVLLILYLNPLFRAH